MIITDDRVVTARWYNMHAHFRQGKTLRLVVPLTADTCQYGLVMPNTQPSITTKEMVEAYQREIEAAIPESCQFIPLMTIKLTPNSNPKIVRSAVTVAKAVKLYFKGTTSLSDDGIPIEDIKLSYPSIAVIEEEQSVLCIHVEHPNSDRQYDWHELEAMARPVVADIARTFSHLRIVFEHISDGDSVPFVNDYQYMAATVTPQHLKDTSTAILGHGIRPHRYCLPTPKFRRDRQMIREEVRRRNPKFIYGNDSAPWSEGAKQAPVGCAGVFNELASPATITETLEELGVLDGLQDFTSGFAGAFWRLPKHPGTITLARQDWIVPDRIAHLDSADPTKPQRDDFIPWRAGETLHWQVVAP